MKKKNGGFTLVELIVVVSIIVVLMGIITPQYIRYLEHSRVRHDDSVITDIQKAANVLVSDGDYDEYITGDIKIYINSQGVPYQLTGVGTASSTVGDEFLDEINASVYGTTTPSGGFTSKTYASWSGEYIQLRYDSNLLTFVTEYHNFPDKSIYYQ